MSVEFDVSGLEDLAADLVRMGLKQSEIYDMLTEALEPVKDEASRSTVTERQHTPSNRLKQE